MKEGITQIISDIQHCNLEGTELEEKEFLLLQELCGSNDTDDIIAIVGVIKQSGTILAIPVLFGILKDADFKAIKGIVEAIYAIKNRTKARGSFLPDEYFTKEHWQPEWLGNHHAFLSYVQFIAESYIKFGFEETEVDRIGQILSEEMQVDLAPFQTFSEFKICQTGWDHNNEFQVIADKIAEEKLFDELEQEGIYGSDLSFITSSLMDLQYDYLVARMKLKGDLRYYRYVLEIAESLNQEATT